MRNCCQKGRPAPAAEKKRTSQILRDILANNPNDTDFSVEKIVNSIGGSSFGTSLMFFAIPEVVPIPIPGLAAIVVIPTAVISAQMAVGHKQIKLPKFILKKSVPRKALAAAIHAILPFLDQSRESFKTAMEMGEYSLGKAFVRGFCLYPRSFYRLSDTGLQHAAGNLNLHYRAWPGGRRRNPGGRRRFSRARFSALLGGVVFGLFSFLGFSLGGRP